MSAKWQLVYERDDPADEGLREALCTLGNGYVATRGATPESEADGEHYPGTYVAGVFNRVDSDVGDRVLEHESMVNAPNWLVLRFRVEDGPWFGGDECDVLEEVTELDVRRGVLTRRLRFSDPEGRVTTVAQRRLVHMSDPHLLALSTTFLPENWSGALRIQSALDGTVTNSGVPRYRDLTSEHLEPHDAHYHDNDVICLEVVTSQSHVHIAEAARTRIYTEAGEVSVPRDVRAEPRWAGEEFEVSVEEGVEVTVEKVASIYTSRDAGISEPAIAACGHLVDAPRFDEMIVRHVLAWDHLWRRCEISTSEGDAKTALYVNLHVFHVLQTVSENTVGLDVGVPARGLHGEAYRGHIFWDELFIFPFLDLRYPELSASLLRYRYRRLPEARRRARAAGLRGAMYPWQSGSDGREESQTWHLNPRSGRWKPDNSSLQRHIDHAIAWNVWHHLEATGDVEFLALFGAEMILEIARFWSSLAVYNRSRDRYEIRGVMGPDEYHDAYPDAEEPGLDNNAYTNVMTAWLMRRALESLELLPVSRREEIRDRIGLERAEIERWEELSRKMFVPFHGDGIISQFEGYEDLEEFDWIGYAERYGDIQRLDRILDAEGDTPNRYKASKQADVLMLFYLLSTDELAEILGALGYEWNDEMLLRNADYYLGRTSHGSTLSSVVHSWVLARADRERSWAFFRRAIASDVEDVQGGTTQEGIHLGAMAGSLDVLQRCYLGLEVRGGVLRFEPRLPSEVEELRLRLRYHGHWGVEVTLRKQLLAILVPPAPEPPMRVACGAEEVEIPAGALHVFELEEPAVEPEGATAT